MESCRVHLPRSGRQFLLWRCGVLLSPRALEPRRFFFEQRMRPASPAAAWLGGVIPTARVGSEKVTDSASDLRCELPPKILLTIKVCSLLRNSTPNQSTVLEGRATSSSLDWRSE